MNLFARCRRRKARVFYPDVILNSPADNLEKDFPSNKISSTKYSLITFLPKNLYEQFRCVYFCFAIVILVSWQGKTDTPSPSWPRIHLAEPIRQLDISFRICGSKRWFLGAKLGLYDLRVTSETDTKGSRLLHSFFPPHLGLNGVSLIANH
jgi:hypothetical protein